MGPELYGYRIYPCIGIRPRKMGILKFSHALLFRDEWRELNWFWKSQAIIKAPLRLVFCLSIPRYKMAPFLLHEIHFEKGFRYHFCLPCRVINEMPMKNWCQYLTLIHCTLSPLFIVFATSTALGKRTVAYLFMFKWDKVYPWVCLLLKLST